MSDISVAVKQNNSVGAVVTTQKTILSKRENIDQPVPVDLNTNTQSVEIVGDQLITRAEVIRSVVNQSEDDRSLILEAGGIINAGRAVKIASDGKAYLASIDDEDSADSVVGISETSALIGDTANVIRYGVAQDVSWNFVPGQPVYLDLNGTLSQDPQEPPVSLFSLEIGKALTINTIEVDIEEPTFLIE